MYYKFSCPVPKDQRPVNEYMELVQSNFFNLPVLSESLFLQKLSKIYFLFFFLSFPFASLIFPFSQFFLKFILLTNFLACFFVILLLLRLLLAWKYIKDRLYSPTIFYEESGWYDGHLWVKSKNILLQDRLIYAYQVRPKTKKLRKSLFYFLFFNVSLFFGILLN